MMPVVVAFGQELAGDDAVGLWVARRLVADGIPARESADATLLLDLLAQGLPLIIVDAVVSAAGSGEVMQLRPAQLASAGVSPVSCHGLGVAEALELAALLYPERAFSVDIVAIPIARPTSPLAPLSAHAQAAIADACTLVRQLLRERAQHPDRSA